MALISCPQCGKQISDKAEKCPGCQYEMKKKNTVKCSECGNDIPADVKVCPLCGCPLETHEVSEKKSNKKLWIIASIAVVVIIASIALLPRSDDSISDTEPTVTVHSERKTTTKPKATKPAETINQEKISEQYKLDISEAVYLMLNGSADAEECGNLIIKVWHHTIFEVSDEESDKFTKVDGVFHSDFNDSLSALINDEEFSKKIGSLLDNQDEVKQKMRELNSPPDDCRDAFEELKKYYEAYMKFTDHVIDMDGSLNTFSDDFVKYDEELMTCYNNMDIYIY